MNNERSRRSGEFFSQLICILLLLSLLAAMLFTVLSRAEGSLALAEVRVDSYTRADTGTGYLFRDEMLITSHNGGVTAYAAQDGSTVRSGELLAEVFNNDTGTDERGVAALLFAEIARCERALAEGEQTWQSDYVRGYDAMMLALADGALAGAAQHASALGDTLARRDAQGAETAEALRARIYECRVQLEALTRSEGAPDTVRATRDGVFCHGDDGLSYVYDIGLVHELTPRDLADLARTARDGQSAVGRVIDTATYYVALPIDERSVPSYTVGEAVNVTFRAAALRLSLTVERVSSDTSGALLILRGEHCPAELYDLRTDEVRVEREVITGLCVPREALYDGNTVFVAEDGVARAREVTPILTEHGCVLLSPEGTALREGERVLFSIRRIYDGKVVR